MPAVNIKRFTGRTAAGDSAEKLKSHPALALSRSLSLHGFVGEPYKQVVHRVQFLL